MIREEIDRLREAGRIFKLEATTTFGKTTYTVRQVIAIDDEGVAFYDRDGKRTALAWAAITRVFE